jgi:repressor LexA
MGRTPAGQSREAVFRFVRDRILAGIPPTVREVQEAFAFRAVESARAHLERLVASGRLVKEPGKARGYRLPAGAGHAPPAWVPVVGRVQAGALTTAVEEPEGYVTTRARPGAELFALRVRGDSMVGAAILAGDVVVVRRQETADDRDIVVALVDDEATVKRLRLRRGRVELHAENPAFAPIIPPPGGVQILGKVVEVHRHLEPEPRMSP